MTYYLEKLPGPGEEEEDLKAREEHAGMAADEEGDFPIPMPPREGEEAAGEEPPTPPQKTETPSEGAQVPLPEPEPEQAAAEETDRRVARPPRE